MMMNMNNREARIAFGVVRMVPRAFIALVLAALFAAFAVTPTASAATHQASFGVGQRITTNSADIRKTYEYCMVADNEDAPMPEGAVDGRYCWTMTGTVNQSVDFDFPVEGGLSYEYTLYQHVTDGQANYTYDSTKYTVRVYAMGYDADGNLNTKALFYDVEGNKVWDPVWTVTYKAPPAPASAAQGPLASTGATVVFSLLLLLLLLALLFMAVRRVTNRRYEQCCEQCGAL